MSISFFMLLLASAGSSAQKGRDGFPERIEGNIRSPVIASPFFRRTKTQPGEWPGVWITRPRTPYSSSSRDSSIRISGSKAGYLESASWPKKSPRILPVIPVGSSFPPAFLRELCLHPGGAQQPLHLFFPWGQRRFLHGPHVRVWGLWAGYLQVNPLSHAVFQVWYLHSPDIQNRPGWSLHLW